MRLWHFRLSCVVRPVNELCSYESLWRSLCMMHVWVCVFGVFDYSCLLACCLFIYFFLRALTHRWTATAFCVCMWTNHGMAHSYLNRLYESRAGNKRILCRIEQWAQVRCFAAAGSIHASIYLRRWCLLIENIEGETTMVTTIGSIYYLTKWWNVPCVNAIVFILNEKSTWQSWHQYSSKQVNQPKLLISSTTHRLIRISTFQTINRMCPCIVQHVKPIHTLRNVFGLILRRQLFHDDAIDVLLVPSNINIIHVSPQWTPYSMKLWRPHRKRER